MSVFIKNRRYAFQGITYYVIRLETQRGRCFGIPFVHLFLTLHSMTTECLISLSQPYIVIQALLAC